MVEEKVEGEEIETAEDEGQEIAAQSISREAEVFNFDWRYAKAFAASSLVPDDYRRNPENCFVAIQMGREVGLKPAQAMQGIAVINGRPCIWGDTLLAIVMASPDCIDVIEELPTHDNPTARCIVKRRGRSDVVREFSVEDATKAGLLSKKGTWQSYPKRMMQMRARAFAIRDAFPDVLKGLRMAEEVQDYDTDYEVEVDAEPTTMTPPAAIAEGEGK